MKATSKSHCAGDDAIPKNIRQEVVKAIEAVTVTPSKGAASKIRDALLNNLLATGWSAETHISNDSEMTITSIKSKIGLCLQTGNMARMYADLLKLQKIYLDGAITAGIMLVPSQTCAQILGDNVAHAARLERELEIFRKVIHIPMVIYSIE
jgi:hypothetical protein